LKNNSQDPESIYEDSVKAAFYANNPRMSALTLDDLKSLDLDQMYQLYMERFANAGDFTFTFVGAVDENQLCALAEKYIASLPSSKQKETVKNRKVNYAQGIHEKNILAGQEEKSVINLMINTAYKNNKMNNTVANAMITVFNEKLRENIREKMSGVYYVYAYPQMNRLPEETIAIYIVLGCSPSRVDELTQAILSEIDKMMIAPCEEKYMNIYRQTVLNAWPDSFKQNQTWLANIRNCEFYDLPYEDFINHPNFVNKVKASDIQKAAKNYLNYKKNFTKVVLYPESKKNSKQ